MGGWGGAIVAGTAGATVGLFSSRLVGRFVERESSSSGRVPSRPLASVICGTAILFMVAGGGGSSVSFDQSLAEGILIVSHLFLATVSAVLAVIDAEIRRLPHGIVLPSICLSLAMISFASIAGGSLVPLSGALTGLIVSLAACGGLRLLRPEALGGGDVTLAALLGLYLGIAGGRAFVVATVVASVRGGLSAVALLVRGGATRQTPIPFGPPLIVGSWVAILVTSHG